MAMIFTLTNSTTGVCAGNAVYCSGAATSDGGASRVASVGGTAGTETTLATSALASSTDNANGLYTLDIPAGTSGDSGTWTIRLNITTANMNLTVTKIYVCRVNSSCTNQETIGSATGLSISLGTTGVKTQTVSGSAVTLAAGDKVVIVFVLSNGAMSDQIARWGNDQNIDSPFSVVVDRRQPPVNRSFAIMRASNY